jgi:RNA polymerase sigma-70 factor (ECF subfamily)
MLVPDHIIQKCKHHDANAQRKLYDLYKDIFFGICVRYVKSKEDAEDVFIEAFFKIFDKISEYKGVGSFEGWMKRIMINESLQYLRRKKNLSYPEEITDKHMITNDDPSDQWACEYTLDSIMIAVNSLPDGYRTIFNMYVFDEYKHKEIAEILGISIHTSKSQYQQAKKHILQNLNKNKTILISSSHE